MAYLVEIGVEISLKYEFDSDHHSFFEKSSQRIKNEDSEKFQNGWMFRNEVKPSDSKILRNRKN